MFITKENRLFFLLSFLMGFIVILSNYLVQFPIKFYDLQTFLLMELSAIQSLF